VSLNLIRLSDEFDDGGFYQVQNHCLDFLERKPKEHLYLFLEEKKLPMGLRVSGENFAVYDKIQTIPLYAVSRIFH
jgi:hypothetical protein